MTDPREDALAKHIATDVLTNCAAHFAQPEAFSAGLGADPQRYIDMAINNAAKIILAAISAPPSQSENDELTGLIEALTPSAETKRAYIGEFSFAVISIGSDGNEITTRLDVPWTTIKQIMKAITARAALTPSPTPYVRPAAEIREQIECCAKFDGPTNKAWVAALTWTITPPTQEPR